MVSSKVGTGSDGNIIAFSIFTTLFPSATMEQLAMTKDASKLRACYHTITQLGTCKVEIENNDKWKNAFSV